MNTDSSLPPHLDSIGRQLVAAAQARETSGSRAPNARRARILLVLAPVATAVALAVVALANTTGSTPVARQLVASGRERSAHGSRPPARASHRHLKLAPRTRPTAKQVLARAAYVALQTTSLTPQPDQFVYTRTEVEGGQITQSWMSVDGTHTSVIDRPGQSTPTTIPGCAGGQIASRMPGENGKPIWDFLPKSLRHTRITLAVAGRYFPGGKVPMDGPLVTSKCTPQPAFYPDMPTDASAMQAYLQKIGDLYPPGVSESPSAALNNVAKNIGYLLDSFYLLPGQQAALYQFLAEQPGIVVRQNVEDVAGRPGIGVAWDFMGSTGMLIFDPSTYQYLGMTVTGEHGQATGDALLQTAITVTAGQSPANTAGTSSTQTSTSTTGSV